MPARLSICLSSCSGCRICQPRPAKPIRPRCSACPVAAKLPYEAHCERRHLRCNPQIALRAPKRQGGAAAHCFGYFLFCRSSAFFLVSRCRKTSEIAALLPSGPFEGVPDAALLAPGVFVLGAPSSTSSCGMRPPLEPAPPPPAKSRYRRPKSGRRVGHTRKCLKKRAINLLSTSTLPRRNKHHTTCRSLLPTTHSGVYCTMIAPTSLPRRASKTTSRDPVLVRKVAKCASLSTALRPKDVCKVFLAHPGPS